MSKSNIEATIAGVDDGHDGIKVYLGINEQTGEPIQYRMLSRAIVGIVNMGDDDTINKELVVVDGDTYTVNQTLSRFENTRNEEYPTSKLSKALVYQALRLAEPKTRTLKIGSGLPVDRFYSGPNKSMNKNLLAAKKQNLLSMQNVYNKYDQLHGIPQLEIAKHVVLCEANAAYYDILFNDEGTELSQIAKETEIYQYGAAVIDIGGRTTDCVVVNPGGNSLNGARSGTIDVGILAMQDELRQELKTTYGWNFISEAQLSNAMLTGMYGAGPNKTDISAHIDKHKQRLFSRIENFIESTIGDASDVPAIILVGGGAYTVGDLVRKRYNNIITPDDVEFSNARGFYKLYKFKFQHLED